MGWIIFSITFIAVAAIFAFSVLAYSENESIIKMWCETRKHISDNKKEIEFRRLETLEKTPELRNLIFHPKNLEK